MSRLRAASVEQLHEITEADFKDGRLQGLVTLYKARNHPRYLTDEERKAWEQHRSAKLLHGGENSRLARYMHRLAELDKQITDNDKRYILEELQLYAEAIMPDAA